MRGGKREGAGRPTLGDSKTVLLGVRVPQALRDAVVVQATADRQGKAEWVREVLIAALEQGAS